MLCGAQQQELAAALEELDGVCYELGAEQMGCDYQSTG